jgi:GT2 family glycosyltransferase
MNGEPRVTICIPVYNGRSFVAETLAAVRRQTYERLTVLVSDDASTDGSAGVCRPSTADPRVRLVVQPERLGWIQNCNWLLRQVEDDFACIVSHDDLPEPGHIERLLSSLADREQCALAFSDIRVFGLLEHVESQPSIDGTPAERVRAFIASHFDGTAFHALIRTRAVEAAGGLRANDRDHFAADVSWLGRLAQTGGFVRVPEPLYRKRRHAASASLQWGHWSEEERAAAWCVHCRELLRDALARPLTREDQRQVARATLRRLLAIEPELPFGFIRQFPRARQAEMAAALAAGLHESLREDVSAMVAEEVSAVPDLAP